MVMKMGMTMSRTMEHKGVVYRRGGSRFWGACYPDKAGKSHRESTFTEYWQEASNATDRARSQEDCAQSNET
jgi:hypothetical protein